MRVAEAWLLYILIVLGVFLLLTFCRCFSLDLPTRLFIAFIIGVILILILIPGITSVTADERTWYSLLLIIAFFIPLAIAIWMLWTRRDILAFTNSNAGSGDGCTVQRESVCGVDGACRVVSETYKCGNKVDVRRYQ